MKIKSRKSIVVRLPSRFQLDDRVIVKIGSGTQHHCVVTGVTITKSKIYYDVLADNGARGTRIDSVHVEDEATYVAPSAATSITACGTTKATPGWTCSREVGHEGPCAAWPVERKMTLEKLAAAFGGTVHRAVDPTPPVSRIDTILSKLRARATTVAAVRDTELCEEIILPEWFNPTFEQKGDV